MRWLWMVSMLFAVGCSTTRQITFTSIPSDADLKIDGAPHGKGPVMAEVKFHGADDVHTFSASRKGFKDQTIDLKRDDDKTAYNIVLKPQSKRLIFGVTPVSGIISIDGRPLNPTPQQQAVTDLEFTVDAKDNWTTHKVRADRPNFAPAEVTVNYTDPQTTYVLNMEPLKKPLTIKSNPGGGDISLDGESLGKAPASVADVPFPFNIEAGEFATRTIKAVKAGYDPVEKTISWDNGQTDYTIDLLAKNKTIRLVTEPANCTVEIDGKKYPVDDSGTCTAKLEFPPTNDHGDLKTYNVVVSKKTESSEWYPQAITLAWDNGKQDYSAVLKEVLTKEVPLVQAVSQRGDNGWQFFPKTVQTLSYKDVTEGRQGASPSKLTKLPKGTMIDTLTVSPDGSSVLFTILIVGTEKNDFRSQMMLIKTDGNGGPTYYSDGKSLDLTPSFTPDGTNIVYSSNRAGSRLSVWQMSAVGAPGVTKLTSGESNDIWATVDADPKPRLFYESLIDGRAEPRLYMVPLGTPLVTDLTQDGGAQPRISPKGDQVVFTGINARSGKRDLFLMSDKGGAPQNLTNTPDVDEFDPAWNKDGSQLAFVSDRGMDGDKHHNFDIWTLDVGKADQPVQVTSNGSWDDCPVWDNSGNTVFFRSNRGGDWNVWKMAVK